MKMEPRTRFGCILIDKT